MSEAPSEAEAWLLDLVRSGDRDGWTQLVERFQGRLQAFARTQLPQTADADDVVQETFLSFLQSLPSYRAAASLETWLFQLLRRRIADHYRRSGSGVSLTLCSAADQLSGGASETARRAASVRVDQSASWYVRRDEQQQLDYHAVSIAILSAVERLKTDRRFDDLKVFDLLFLAHWRNRDIAENLSLDEKSIALRKYRFIQRVAAGLSEPEPSDPEADESSLDGLLTELWQDWRPSCPKRTTLGKYLLETLEEDWDDYVQFHIETMGCRFCSANLDDLEAASDEPGSDPLRDRIMESTVGFLNPREGG